MVWTRSQLENLSKKELIEELITVEDITSKLSDLSSRFDVFFDKIWSCFLWLSHYKNLLIGTNGKPFGAVCKFPNAIVQLMIGKTLATNGEEITNAMIGNDVLAIFW